MKVCRTVGMNKFYYHNNRKINAIIDCNIEIKAGECIAICGSKDSGKSTLLRILGGLERPTTGSVFIGDQDITNYTDDELAILRRKEIGYLFQKDSLIPELNVHENITMPAILAHNKYDEKYYEALTNQLNLQELLTNKPKQLTQYQLQAVSYARVLMNDPNIILVDNPENDLSQLMDKSILDYLLSQVYTKGKTLIMVTEEYHYDIYVDHIIRLEHGAVVENKRIS